jgi:hypothetical protein
MYLADFQDWLNHKVHIYLENHSVYPLVQIGTPYPLSRKQVCLLCVLSKIRENI